MTSDFLGHPVFTTGHRKVKCKTLVENKIFLWKTFLLLNVGFDLWKRSDAEKPKGHSCIISACSDFCAKMPLNNTVRQGKGVFRSIVTKVNTEGLGLVHTSSHTHTPSFSPQHTIYGTKYPKISKIFTSNPEPEHTRLHNLQLIEHGIKVQ